MINLIDSEMIRYDENHIVDTARLSNQLGLCFQQIKTLIFLRAFLGKKSMDIALFNSFRLCDDIWPHRRFMWLSPSNTNLAPSEFQPRASETCDRWDSPPAALLCAFLHFYLNQRVLRFVISLLMCTRVTESRNTPFRRPWLGTRACD